MEPLTITKANFNELVLSSDVPVLVDFWAAWCGPCRALTPTIEELAQEATGFKVGKINVDDEPELASSFNVMSIPTLLVFKDGKVTNKAVGVQTKAYILSMFE